MKRAAILFLVAVAVASCAAPDRQALTVKQFTLRETNPSVGDDLMVRGEVQRRLYGAVTPAERVDRLGQYYTAIWNVTPGAGPVEVVFEYQQAGTGAVVKRSFQRFAAGTQSGQAEFRVTGEDFRKNGRVLAWRVGLRCDGREVASRQSYMWR